MHIAEASCLPHIKKLFLRLQKYSFVFEYSPGKKVKVADTLSRTYTIAGRSKSEIAELDMTHYVNSVLQILPISASMLQRLQSETASDSTLQKLKEYTIRSWPSKPDISPCLLHFYQHPDDIVHYYDLLLKGQRKIIPSSMPSEIKSIINQRHQSQDKCILGARNTVFWPGINLKSLNLNNNVLNASIIVTDRNMKLYCHMIFKVHHGQK